MYSTAGVEGASIAVELIDKPMVIEEPWRHSPCGDHPARFKQLPRTNQVSNLYIKSQG